MAALTRRLALVVALAGGGCYSPRIRECTILCGAGGACPSDMRCAGDGYCHFDVSVTCSAPGADGGALDARVANDGRPSPDAPPGRDAMTPDGAPACTPSVVTVESSPDEVSVSSNLSVADDGHVHITYVDSSHGLLRYAHRAPGADTWQLETVAQAADDLKGQTLDATGALHVAFTDRHVYPRLRYARRGPDGMWSVETVDDTALGIDASIAVDDNLRVHIVYWYNQSELEYATRSANGLFWSYDVIDDLGVVGEHPSLAIAPSGALEVSYRVDGTGQDLGLAERGSSQTFWRTARPDTDGDVGSYTALAIDAAGATHIAYADNGNGHLKYLFLPPGGPKLILTADDSSMVGRFNSLALDREGGVHISYYDYGNGDLRYAVKPPGAASFQSRAIDSEGDVGSHSSLVLDAAGVAHISYIDDTHGDLKYAVVCP